VNTSNTLWMRAPAHTVYRLAAEVERWPELLPHYRWVTVLERKGHRKLVEMAARRDAMPASIPVRWQAVQELDPHTPEVRFRHVRGVTRGMDVAWRFREQDGGTLVTIDHALDLRWPLVGQFVAERIIGPFFVAYIAGKTLRRIKQLAEAEARTTGGTGVGATASVGEAARAPLGAGA
jgi:ribosome-associated toxin RatA of RatAB toxin-antitoxin module